VNILEIGSGNFRSKNASVATDIKRYKDIDMVCDAHFLPFKNDSFDSVLMFEVLEHVESPIRVIREIRRVLEDKGILVFSFPNVYYFRHILKWIFKGKASSVSKEHISSWSLAESTNLLNLNGFAIVHHELLDYQRHNKSSKIANLLPRITKHSLRIIAEVNKNVM